MLRAAGSRVDLRAASGNSHKLFLHREANLSAAVVTHPPPHLKHARQTRATSLVHARPDVLAALRSLKYWINIILVCVEVMGG